VKQFVDFSWDDTWNDAGWLSFYDFFQRIGVKLHDARFEKYRDLMRARMGISILCRGIAIVSRMPIALHRDERGRLHHLLKSAIEWKDGYCQHYVEGVFFPQDLFEKAFVMKTLTAKELLAVKNAQQKAVLIKHYGYARIMAEVQAKLLDEGEENGNQYGVFEFDAGDSVTARVLQVQCPTTKDKYFLGVPREKQTENWKGARAWTFGLDELTLTFET